MADFSTEVEEGWEIIEGSPNKVQPSPKGEQPPADSPVVNLRASTTKLKLPTFIGGKWIELESEAGDDEIQESEWELVPVPPPALPAEESFTMKRYMEVLEPQKLHSFDIMGDTIVTGCTKMCGSWSLTTGARQRPFRGVTAPVSTLKFIHRGAVVAAQNNGSIVVWDTQLGETLHFLKDAEFEQGLEVLDSERIAVGCGSEIRVFDVVRGFQLMNLAKAKQPTKYTSIHSSTDVVLAGQVNGQVVMYDKTSYAELKTFDVSAKKDPVTAVRTDGTSMLVAVGDTIQIWDMRKWAKEKELTGHKNDVTHLDMLNSYIASGSEDSTVRLWSSDTGTCITTLNHLYPIRDVRIVDADTVAAGGHKFHLSVIPGSPSANISSVVVWRRRRKTEACSVS